MSKLQATRRAAQRSRSAIPWLLLLLTLPVLGFGCRDTGSAWLGPVTGAALGAYLLYRAWRKTGQWKDRRRRLARVYALSSATVMLGWLSWVALGPGIRPAMLAWIPAWLVCYLPWWNEHRPRHRHGEPEPEEIPRDELLERLRDRVCGQGGTLPGAEVAEMDPIPGGRRFKFRLVPGKQTAGAATTATVKASIASAAELPTDRVVSEPVPGEDGERGPEHLFMVTVLDRIHPQKHIQEFAGPTFDPATGLFDVGPYPDGEMARARLLKVDEHGSPIRSASGLTAGTTGAGKSRYEEHKIMEHLASGLFQVVLLDGQGGASIPALTDHVGWAALYHEEWQLAMRAMLRLLVARTRLIASKRLSHWDPGLGPFVQLPLEEAQKPLLDPMVLRAAKHILQEGEKVGMAEDLSTQFPSQVELGGGSGTTGANVLRDLAASGNVTLFRTGSEFAKSVTVGNVNISPRDLPRVPGMCHPLGVSMREAPVRAIRSAEPAEWAHLFSPLPFSAFDIKAMDGSDGIYSRRTERLERHLSAAEAGTLDMAGLDAEVALMLNETTAEAAGSAGKPTCVQAVWETVSKHGPMKRAGIITALSDVGLEYTPSSVDNALATLKKQGGIRGTGTHGEYERATPLAGANAGNG